IGRIYDVGFVFFRNGWKPHKLPVFLLQYVPHQIVLMQTLHNDDYAATPLIVQPAVEGVIEPFVRCIALRFGECLIGLEWIVDDDQVRTTTGHYAADGGSQTKTILRSQKLLNRLPLRRKASGKQTSVPLAGHYSSAVHGMLVGQILPVAGTDDLGTGIVAQNVRWESNRGRVRFQRTRWH